MANYSIAEALNVTLKQKGLPVLFSDYANTSNFDISSEAIYSRGKGKNIIRFDKNRQGSVAFDFEIFDMKHVALFLGATQQKGSTNIHKVETLTVGVDKKITVEHTPVAGSVVAFTTQPDGRTHDKALTVTTSGSQITITDTPAVAEGTHVIVYYLTVSGESSTTTTISAEKFAGNFEIVGETVSKDVMGELVPIEFRVFNAVPQGNLSLALGDSVATLSMVFDMLPDSKGNIMETIEIAAP